MITHSTLAKEKQGAYVSLQVSNTALHSHTVSDSKSTLELKRQQKSKKTLPTASFGKLTGVSNRPPR